MAQRAANKHLAGFDCGGELKNRHDFQLSAIVGFAILRIVEHEAPPLSGQRVRWHAINPVVVAVRRRFVRHRINETEQVARRCRCLQRQYTRHAQQCATQWLQCRLGERPPIPLLMTQMLGAILFQSNSTAASSKKCLEPLQLFGGAALAPMDEEGFVKGTDQ